MIWLYFAGVILGLSMFILSTYVKNKGIAIAMIAFGMVLTLTMYGLLTGTLDHKFK